MTLTPRHRAAARGVTSTALGLIGLASAGCLKDQAPLEPVPAAPAAYSTPAPVYPGGHAGAETVSDPPAELVVTPAAPAEPVVMVVPEPEPIAAPQPVPAVRTYTVQKGDSLWKIAKREYGSGLRWTDIRDANPGLGDLKKMQVGTEIILPE